MALESHCGVKLSIAFLFRGNSRIKVSTVQMYVGEDEWAARWPQPNLRVLCFGKAIGPEDLQKSFPVRVLRFITQKLITVAFLHPSVQRSVSWLLRAYSQDGLATVKALKPFT